MEKVSVWAAAKKTLLLLRGRAEHFWKYGVGLLVLQTVSYTNEMIAALPDGGVWWLEAIMNLAFFVGSVVLTTSLIHFSIASCRNTTSFLPERPVLTVFYYVLAMIALSVITFIFMVVCGLPLIGVVMSGLLDKPDTVVLGGGLAFLTGLFALAGGMVPAVRFGVIIPAVCVRDKWNFSLAWQMTKGHTWRLIGAVVLPLLPFFALVMGWGVAYALMNPETPFVPNIPYVAVSIFASAAIGLFMNSFCGVLYEDFRIRYEAMTNPPDEFQLSEAADSGEG